MTIHNESRPDVDQAAVERGLVPPRPIPFPPPFPFPPPVPLPAAVVSPIPTPTLAGAVGCDYRPVQHQLVFVEFGGLLSALDLFPAATEIGSGTTVLPGTYLLDLDTGVVTASDADIFWEQMTSTERQMVPLDGAAIVNLGAVDFPSLSPAALQTLPYGSAPIPANDDATNRLVPGDVFAVRTSSGNYAKVLVVAYGYDITLKWVTYRLQSGYHVLGTGYSMPEDVRLSVDGTHAYVTERTGNLLRVDLANADRVNATVVASGMTAPQQLVLDESAGVAYTVEYAAAGTLWRVDLATGAMTAAVSGLDHPVGVAISPDHQFAYVSEQTAGPDAGRVSQIRLANGQRTVLATGLVAPFFLTWSDAAQTSLLCPQRDPANSLVTVSLSGGGATLAASGLAFRPSCVAVVSPGTLLVTCNDEIEQIQLGPTGQQPNGPLLESIGFVPKDWITAGGLADTTSHDPSYFFPVHDAPFGATLPVMVNFVDAGLQGASFYQVTVDGAANVRTDVFHTAKWNGSAYEPVTVSPTTVNGVTGLYSVPTISDLGLYIDPLPGCYLDSTNLTDGALHTITVQLYDASGTPMGGPDSVTVLIDNRPCSVTLSQAAVGGNTATTTCGFLTYTDRVADDLLVAFTATQPGGFGTWSFTLTKASNAVVSLGGPVPAPPPGLQESVDTALGTCPTSAAFAAQVYAAATATTGWGRCSQYDRSLTEAFALTQAG